MNLFLIGCTGFIGRELVPQLANAGHKLSILSRKKINQSAEGITRLLFNPTNPETWQQEKVISELKKLP